MNRDPVGHTPCGIGSALVIDDHPLYCDALTSALARVFPECEIESASTLAEALSRLKSGFQPDLIILDLRLPDVAGISGFLRLKEVLPSTPILINSALTAPDVVRSLITAGAAGFVPKDVPITTFQTALCEVRAGRTYLPTEYRQQTRRAVPPPVDTVEINQKIANLTPQQTRIMKLICAGLANKQIANELSLAEATVKAHITAILRRLGVQNRTQAAVMMEYASLDGGVQADVAGARAFLNG
jgi:DNA-binding NarL/FixJ family response regulator